VLDRRGNFIEANEATEELTGYDAEELRSISIFNLIAGSDLDDTQKAFSDVFLKKHASRDRTIICKDGTEKIIRVDGVRHTAEKAICFSRDITDRKLSEEKLLRLNAMLRAVRRVNKAIVDTPDIDGLIRKICGILVEDREFKHAWIALLDDDHRPLYYCDSPKLKDAEKLKSFLQAGQLPECIKDTKTEDGLIIASNPIEQCPDFPVMEGLEGYALLGFEFNYDGRVGYIALMANRAAVEDEEEVDLFREVAEDLRFALQGIRAEAERKRATEDLVVAKQAAENANRAKDEFLSVMSHELRTPLNPIMGHTSLLLEQVSDPEKTDSLKQITRSSERLLALIDDILFFAQLKNHSEAYPQAPFHLLECCESALEKSRKKCPGQSIEFENGSGDYQAIDPGVLIAGEREYIFRIVDELLCNACKYTHEGVIYFRVGQRKADAGDLEALFEVEDSGIGIKKEVLGKLFDPFMQADSSRTRRYEGVGLGLAICRKIADILGGSLTAESQPGVGSCFRFRCQLKTLGRETTREQASRSPNSRNDSAAGHVLLVEDNPSNAVVAKTMLKRCGLSADLAENGKLAVEKCNEQRYDLILMDLSMPVMNGLDATQLIKTSTRNRATPIIGLTAHVSADVKQDCHNAGMAGFIAKPIRLDTFKELISDYVSVTGK